MAALDVGILPVGQDDRLVGMITGRDIVVRALAQNRGAEIEDGEIMTRHVKYCFEDQEIAEITENMGNLQVRRLPVLNRDKRLVGIITIGGIAAVDEGPEALYTAFLAREDNILSSSAFGASSVCRYGSPTATQLRLCEQDGCKSAGCYEEQRQCVFLGPQRFPSGVPRG